MSFEVVGRFRTPPQASLVRGRLAAEGIDAFLLDEHYIGLDWLLSTALGGVRLVVAPDDAVPAAEVLGAFDQGEVDYEPADGQPRLGVGHRHCVHCEADALVPYSLQRHLAAVTMMPWPLLVVALPVFLLSLPFTWKSRWTCLTCQRRSARPAEEAEES